MSSGAVLLYQPVSSAKKKIKKQPPQTRSNWIRDETDSPSYTTEAKLDKMPWYSKHIWFFFYHTSKSQLTQFP